ncbi:MAG TPA: HAD family hydrolase [Thermoflexia bacterium]|nr:HAD family hydrolase [Thermoflexia bacterium]
MTIQAITFDFWSTLYHHTQSPQGRRLQRIQTALASAGRDDIGEAALSEAMERAWDTWNRVWRGKCYTLGAAEWLRLVLEHVGGDLPAAIFSQSVAALETEILTDTTVPVEGAAAVLARLATQYQLGLISDTGIAPGRVLQTRLERDGLRSYFTHLTFSDEFGRSKPHPDVFRDTLAQLQVAPRQAVHVGDLLRTDISGARGVGMYTVRYAGIRDDRDALYPDADAIIKNYSTLEAVLERIY